VPNADLVLEGGGVKGLGLVGAVSALMQGRYTVPRAAGTSAGAIVAAFVAAGAGADQLARIMDRLEYDRVPDRASPGIPLASEAVSLLAKGGAHPGEYVHEFVRAELETLGVRTFADLRLEDPAADAHLPPSRRYKLVVMVTDITHGRLLRLPWDYRELFDLDPDEQLVADAVRASMSIPLYFEPQTLRHAHTDEASMLVDGGVLSNFPIEAFDRCDGRAPRWPTFGIRVLPTLPGADSELFPALGLPTLPPLRQLERVLATAIVGNDQTQLERPCVARRSFAVDTSEVGIVQFGVDERVRDEVVVRGRRAAETFLKGWDWDAYLRECRGGTLT
jgi:NTE family protein